MLITQNKRVIRVVSFYYNKKICQPYIIDRPIQKQKLYFLSKTNVVYPTPNIVHHNTTPVNILANQ